MKLARTTLFVICTKDLGRGGRNCRQSAQSLTVTGAHYEFVTAKVGWGRKGASIDDGGEMPAHEAAFASHGDIIGHRRPKAQTTKCIRGGGSARKRATWQRVGLRVVEYRMRGSHWGEADGDNFDQRGQGHLRK